MESQIERFRRGTRALRAWEQQYGERLVKILERHDPQVLRWFDDPLEAAAFLLFVGVLRDLDKRDLLVPDQC